MILGSFAASVVLGVLALFAAHRRTSRLDGYRGIPWADALLIAAACFAGLGVMLLMQRY